MAETAFPAIGPQQIDAVLRYVPLFEGEDFVPGEWQTREGQLPYFVLSPVVNAFIETLYEHAVLLQFDWLSWREEAQRYRSDPSSLQKADLLTLRKLLTLHVGADRFEEGHLASMFETGHILAILHRLKQIRHNMPGRA